MGLALSFKLFVHSFDFYSSAFLSLEIIDDKSNDPCYSTKASPGLTLL
jgi:hypothetical protein